MVLMGSGVGGIIGVAPVDLGGETENFGAGAAFGVGTPPISMTAGAVGSGTVAFSPPITFSAIVGILKFGAFGMGRETDSVWRTIGLRDGAGDEGGTGFLRFANSSSEGGFSETILVGSFFGGGGIADGRGAPEGTIGNGAGTGGDIFAAGRISSIIFGAIAAAGP